jgi:hypothetical protein
MRLALWIVSLVLVAAASATAAGVLVTSSKQVKSGTLKVSDLSKKARSDLAGARAYGQVRAVDQGGGDFRFQLIPGTSKNVVTIKHQTSGNSAACVILKPSIDARKAVAVATPLFELGGSDVSNAKVTVVPGLEFGCDRPEVGFPAKRVLAFHTGNTTSPGAVDFKSFSFIVG